MKATFNLPEKLDITDQDPATEVYQAVELLEFDRDAMASGLLIDEFILDGDFKAIDINVLANDAPIKAQLEKPDKYTWIVRLPRPFQLQKINVQQFQIVHIVQAEGLITAGYFDYILPEFRLSVGAALASKDRISRIREQAIIDFEQRKHWTIEATQIDIFPVVGDKVLSESIASVANNIEIDDLTLEAFAVRARDSANRSGMALQVAQHGISVYVCSQPQGLNLGLAPVTDDAPALEEITELSGFNLASNQDTVPFRDNSGIWLSGLQDFLDKNFKASENGDTFKVAVVFRSENPCLFESDASSNAYRLQFRDLTIFPNINAENPDLPLEQKQVFTGNQWQNSYYQLSLPASSQLHSAVLPFKHTLKKNAFSFVDSTPSEQSLVNAKAIELTSDQWAGAIFQLASAQSVRYLLLPLMAMQSDTVCALEIREDINGLPSGSIVTQQSLHLGEVGQRVWMSVPLEDSVPLYSKKLWWLVRTTQGKAIQFGKDNPQGSGITHFSLSESGGPGSVFRFTREFSLTPFFAKDDADSEKMHAFIAQGDSWLALESSEETAGNLNQFNLLPGLPDQAQATVTTITLRLASLLKGNVKLYSPEIIYELVE
jgi:hypothetical protein